MPYLTRMKKLLLITILTILVGCTGISLNEIRSNPPIYSANSTKTIDRILMCLVSDERLGEFRGDGRLHILTLPDEAEAEVAIGAQQAGTFRYFYHVFLSRISPGTRIELRQSATKFAPMSQDELKVKIGKCVENV